jgi:hypothetical protein
LRGEVQIGAALIKNYASLDKNEKKFHVFFLKLLPIKVLQKFCTEQRGTKELKRNQRESWNFPPSPFCPTAYSSKLTPAGCNL